MLFGVVKVVSFIGNDGSDTTSEVDINGGDITSNGGTSIECDSSFGGTVNIDSSVTYDSTTC